MDPNHELIARIIQGAKLVGYMDSQLAELSKEPPVEKIEKPERCQMIDCKTKLLLSDFACQCKKFYCLKHRHSEIHMCSFDYKAASEKLLEKGLVKTIADKLERI